MWTHKLSDAKTNQKMNQMKTDRTLLQQIDKKKWIEFVSLDQQSYISCSIERIEIRKITIIPTLAYTSNCRNK